MFNKWDKSLSDSQIIFKFIWKCRVLFTRYQVQSARLNPVRLLSREKIQLLQNCQVGIWAGRTGYQQPVIFNY